MHRGGCKDDLRPPTQMVAFTGHYPRAMIPPMSALVEFLPYIQITLSVILLVTVLSQRTGASLGGAFGADNFSSGFHTRRGLEKTLFNTTIVVGILFALSALVTLFVH